GCWNRRSALDDRWPASRARDDRWQGLRARTAGPAGGCSRPRSAPGDLGRHIPCDGRQSFRSACGIGAGRGEREMSAKQAAMGAGIRRGAIEFRNSLKTPTDLGYYVVGNAIFIVVMVLNRGNMVDELGITSSRFIFPGVLAMILVFVATFGLATVDSTERVDGPLLR